MNTWRFLFTISFMVLLAGASRAAGQDLDPEFRADIMRLMEITGSAKRGQQMAMLISQQILNQLKNARPDLPARAFDIAKEVTEAEFTRAFSAPGGVTEKMNPLYARYFTRQEVRGLLAFYETDLGKKTIEVMPKLMQDGARLGQEWVAENMPRVQALLQERLKAEGFMK